MKKESISISKEQCFLKDDENYYNKLILTKTIRNLVIVLIILLSTFIGCNKESSHNEKLKIAGIVFQDDQYMRLVLFGMQQAANSANAEFLQGCTYNKPDKEIELINTYIAMGVDAIVITPISSKASVTALKIASAKGIKIVTFNTRVDSDIPSAHVQCSDSSMGCQTGKAAKRYILEKLSGKANVAILAFKSQLPEQSNERVQNFINQIKDLPGVEIVAEQDAWLADQAIKKAGDIMTAHPEVDVIFSANEGGCVGSVLAVKNAGKAGKVAVFGIGASEQIDGFILSNENILQAVVDASPIEVGTLAVERVLNVFQNQPYEKITSLPGVLVSRTDPQFVKSFDARLKEAISKGSN